MSDPLCKRTAQLRRRPGPQPAAPTRAELFREAFMAALTGLCAQYEQRMLPNGKPCFSEGQSELHRAKQICRRAWNTACYAVAMFEETATTTADEEAEIDQFNASIVKTNGGGKQ